MTDSNLTRFALVKEATRNTTPANPIFQIMRATGITLTDNNQTVANPRFVKYIGALEASVMREVGPTVVLALGLEDLV